jgi:hypothetical protein
MSGIVVRIKSGLKLVLSVQLLQRSIAVEIDRSRIRATQSTRAAEHRAATEVLDAAAC